jgi:hypothetical protein
MFNQVLKSFARKPNAASLSKLANPMTRPMAASAAFSTSQPKYAPWEESKILLTGCQGQIGVPLVRAICEELGAENVIASDVSDQLFDFDCEY